MTDIVLGIMIAEMEASLGSDQEWKQIILTSIYGTKRAIIEEQHYENVEKN